MKHKEYFNPLLDELRELLEKRLDQLDRWNSFELFSPWDKLPDDLKESQDDYYFHILWQKPKTENNVSSPELRSYPVWDIHKKIARTKERLENERKTYK